MPINSKQIDHKFTGGLLGKETPSQNVFQLEIWQVCDKLFDK
jgi:hypothetical protein